MTKRFALAASGSDPDLGKKGRDGRLAGDFEDIAIVGDRFFLVSSNGVLLEFAEGQNGGSVPYRAYPTGLEQVCEVEGLAHDPSTKSLLLLCKTMREKSQRQQVAVYSWSLADRTRGDTPRLVVPWSTLAQVTGGTGFNGSAVALTPGGRSLLIVAGPQQLYAEVGSDGAPLHGGSLDQGTHPQPESLASCRTAPCWWQVKAEKARRCSLAHAPASNVSQLGARRQCQGRVVPPVGAPVTFPVTNGPAQASIHQRRRYRRWLTCASGRSSRQAQALPKLDVAGSSPVARSLEAPRLA